MLLKAMSSERLQITAAEFIGLRALALLLP
jgi:hypothetical protein